jgi:hypothetical protein
MIIRWYQEFGAWEEVWNNIQALDLFLEATVPHCLAKLLKIQSLSQELLRLSDAQTQVVKDQIYGYKDVVMLPKEEFANRVQNEIVFCLKLGPC